MLDLIAWLVVLYFAIAVEFRDFGAKKWSLILGLLSLVRVITAIFHIILIYNVTGSIWTW